MTLGHDQIPDQRGGSPAPAAPGLVRPPVAVLDAEGTVTGWTDAAERLLGYAAADVVNRSAAALLVCGDDTMTTSGWAERMHSRAVWSGLVEARHRDGRVITLSVEVRPLTTADGSTRWAVSATGLADITGRTAGNETVLLSLFDRSPVAVSIWDLDLRCIWLNDRTERQEGVLGREALGVRAKDAFPGFDTVGIEAAMLRVLADGIPVVDRESRWTAADNGEHRSFAVSFFRLDGADGRPLGVYAMAVDISRSWARQRLAVLGEANTRIGSTLDVMKTAQELADLAVPLLADYVTVDLAESVPLGEEPLQRLDATELSVPVFRRAGLASIHEGSPESIWQRGEAVFVPPSSPFTSVLASGRSHFEPVQNIAAGGWLDQDPVRARTVREFGMHSLMIVSLEARGETLGIAVFVRTDNPTPFGRDDLLLAEGFADRAALSLDNARRYTRERTAALALQRNLLPRNLSGGKFLDVASRYLPANRHDGVGGDWFDVIPLSGDRVALVMGDVVGHGINAAATMGRLRTAVRTLAYLDLAPGRLLARLDDLIVRMTEEEADGNDLFLPDMGATCVYGVYNPATRLLTIARAGHPPPAIVSPGGIVSLPDLPAGTPIGLGLVSSFESVQLELADGSMIALYTDGLVGTRDPDSGMDRLTAALAQTWLPLEALCSAVINSVVGGAPAEDDIALLLARTRSSGHGRAG